MFAYLPLVILGTFVYRVFIYTPPPPVSTQEKQTQTETWCGMNILDLMDVETDTDYTDEHWSISCSEGSSRETDKKNV